MTEESLKRAKELEPLIKECKAALRRWVDVYKLTDNMEGHFKGESSGRSYLPTKHVPLDVLKVLVIDKYTAELKELSREFNSL